MLTSSIGRLSQHSESASNQSNLWNWRTTCVFVRCGTMSSIVWSDNGPKMNRSSQVCGGLDVPKLCERRRSTSSPKPQYRGKLLELEIFRNLHNSQVVPIYSSSQSASICPKSKLFFWKISNISINELKKSDKSSIQTGEGVDQSG